jgi:hypothetical protein
MGNHWQLPGLEPLRLRAPRNIKPRRQETCVVGQAYDPQRNNLVQHQRMPRYQSAERHHPTRPKQHDRLHKERASLRSSLTFTTQPLACTTKSGSSPYWLVVRDFKVQGLPVLWPLNDLVLTTDATLYSYQVRFTLLAGGLQSLLVLWPLSKNLIHITSRTGLGLQNQNPLLRLGYWSKSTEFFLLRPRNSPRTAHCTRTC